ncbi:MAG: hypothetical protein RKO25_08895, partial [Candidatus Contendobacter sp.]|nr:hypothetical protein [Candidatus Contendobacter sp.]
MPHHHYIASFLFILLISLFIFSIPAGAAPTLADAPGSTPLEYGRLHPRAGAEHQPFPALRPAEPDKAITDLDPRQPQAVGDATCGSAWEVALRSDALVSVAYGAGLYVTVGGDGAIQTSPDGVTWTPSASALTNVIYDLSGVTWGGNQFVAVGSGILTSPDGVTWTPRDSGVVAALSSVTWGGNQFVAVGNNGTILTSPDGMTWTPRDSGVTHPLSSVTWGGNLFMAVGGGDVLTSPDGVTWTLRASGVAAALSSVTWGGNQFVAVGNNGTILTSPDGVTWTPRDSGATYNFRGVTWGGNQFVAVGDNGTILTSPDG